MEHSSRSRPTLGRTGLSWLSLLAIVWLAGSLRGQVSVPDLDGHQILNRVLVLAPREYQQLLRESERAIEQAQFSEAIRLLGQLMDVKNQPNGPLGVQADEDFFIGHPGESHFASSLRGEAQRLLGSLPPQGLQLYELNYGATAKTLLEKALAERDIKTLSEVCWRYSHTQAGTVATVMLARHYLDTGQPLAASLLLKRLVVRPDVAREYGPELPLLLAISLASGGREKESVETLERLKESHPNASFTVSGKPVELYEDDEEPLAWLQQNFQLSTSDQRQLHDWKMHRGTPSRNPRTNGGMMVKRLRWYIPLATTPDDEALIASLLVDLQEEGVAPIPSVAPIVVDDVIILRTPDTLLAVDFKTGKRVWEYPWGESPQAILDVGLDTRSNQQRREQLKERLFHDAIYGQLTTDGRSVFFVDELTYVDEKASPQAVRPLRNQSLDPRRFTNELVALDVATQGKYRWRVGGLTGGDEPELARTFFLGSPLVVGDRLYVMGEARGDLTLHVLDAATGELKWSQLLAHVSQSNISIDRVRRLAGASPSYSDGILVCPTSAGAVVAIDVATRSLLWGRQYERDSEDPSQRPRGLIRFNARRSTQEDRWWLDSTAVLGQGYALVTPKISNKLHCIDLLDGSLNWSIDRTGDELQFVAAIDKEVAIVVGNHLVVAYRLDDGEPAWQLPLDSETSIAELERPSGRGFVSGNRLFLPTTQRLLVIDIERGELVEELDTPETLGNLVSYRGQVLSLTPTRLTAFYQIDALQSDVTQRLRETPTDAWGLAHRALLNINAGRAHAALPDLRQALESFEPGNDEREATRLLLVETLMSIVESEESPNDALLAELELLIERISSRERFLILRGQKQLAAGQIRAAFDSYLELCGAQLPTRNMRKPNARLIEDLSGKLLVRRDRLVRSGIRGCLAAATDDERRYMHEQLAILVATALESQDPQVVRERLSVLADAPLSAPLRLWLAEHYFELGDYLRVEQTLLPLLTESEPGLQEDAAGTAWAMYCKCMQAADRPELVEHALQLLGTRYRAAEVDDGRTGAEFVAERKPGSSTSTQVEAWPYGRVEVKKLVGSTNLPPSFGVFAKHQTVLLTERYPSAAATLQVAYDDSGANSIVITDSNGEALVSIPRAAARAARFSRGTMTSKTMGHLTLVNYGRGLLALDALAGAQRPEQTVLWPDDFQDELAVTRPSSQAQSRHVENAWGQTQVSIRNRRVNSIGNVSPNGVVYLEGNRLFCVDPVTGELQWRRLQIVPDARVWGDHETVFVAASDGVKADAYRLLDGKHLGEFTIPNDLETWATIGNSILAWDHDAPHRLRLFDVLGQRNLWEREFELGARGYLNLDHHLAVVEPSGRCRLMDVITGNDLWEHQLAPTPRKLSNVLLLSFPDQYLVVRNLKPIGKPPEGTQYTPFPDQVEAPMIDGEIYAFDRETGERQWQTPAVIEAYGLPRQQPTNLPVLTFARQVTRRDNTARRRPNLDVLCIDRRDGRPLINEQDLQGGYGSYSIVGTPDQHRVALRMMSAHNYLLTFTDAPQPPAPPVQTGSSASQKNAGLSEILDAIFDWGRPSRQEGEPRDKRDDDAEENEEEEEPPQE